MIARLPQSRAPQYSRRLLLALVVGSAALLLQPLTASLTPSVEFQPGQLADHPVAETSSVQSGRMAARGFTSPANSAWQTSVQSDSLCPKCGAYWRCNCATEELVFTPDANCEHDWVEVVGVELDEEIGTETGQVYSCRLCGKFSANDLTGTNWRR